jgi:uncharacterized protein YaaN involved in tellurite resistance
MDFAQISQELDVLAKKADAFDVGGIMTQLMHIVQEFNPNYDQSGTVSPVFKRLRPDIFPEATTIH